MFTLRHYPSKLTPEMLDNYLQDGWFRMGQSIFTCRFLFCEVGLKSTVWSRLPLKGYTYTRSLRKIFRKNNERFRVEIGPASIDWAKEYLYQDYKANFKGRLAPSLSIALFDDQVFDIYNTYETRVYDGDRLIAFSFFDLGKKSIESIKGVYDVNYSKYSLGLYTMILEVEFGIANGYDYYYPGYFTPGYNAFDYKLRLGDQMEYFSWDVDGWLPITQFEQENVPHLEMEYALQKFGDELKEYGIASQVYWYPPYELEEDVFFPIPQGLRFPVFLQIFPENTNPYVIGAVYDWREGSYQLYRFKSRDILSEFFKSRFSKEIENKRVYANLLLSGKLIYRAQHSEELLSFILQQLSGGSKR